MQKSAKKYIVHFPPSAATPPACNAPHTSLVRVNGPDCGPDPTEAPGLGRLAPQLGGGFVPTSTFFFRRLVSMPRWIQMELHSCVAKNRLMPGRAVEAASCCCVAGPFVPPPEQNCGRAYAHQHPARPFLHLQQKSDSRVNKKPFDVQL